MWTRNAFALIVAVTVACVLCVLPKAQSQCLSANDAEPPRNKAGKLNLYEGEQKFTLAVLDAINKAKPTENIFFSPYSIYHALLLAYFGARGQTEKYLQDALHLQWAANKNEVRSAYRHEVMQRARKSNSSTIEFSSANRIFLSPIVSLRDCMEELFADELVELDFQASPENARMQINDWVATITKNQIKDLLPTGALTSATKIVLANAAYFKGNWNNQFDPANTKQEIFYTSSEHQEFVSMMSRKGSYYHSVNEKLGAHVLEMPYAGELSDISFFIFLPPFERGSLDKMLSNITPELLKQVIGDGMPREVELKLPRFTLEKTLELVPILETMGIGDLFTSSANLTGFSKNGESVLQLDDAVHKAKLEVTEEGSTAAAATVLFSFRSSRPADPVQIHCKSPFMYMIYDHKAKAILFAGTYRGAKN